MLGIDPADQRDRMEEALEIILALLRTDEPVTHESEWFTLRDARLHLRPYTQPHPEVAVAAMISPSGPRAAGKFGCSLLSIGATQRAGIDLLGPPGRSWRSAASSSATSPTDGSGASSR